MKAIAFLFFLPMMVAAQTKGIVRDSVSGKPVPYVNIWIDGQNSGTTADSLGQYAVKTTNASARLVFSAPGYKSKKIALTEMRRMKLSPLPKPAQSVQLQKTQTQVLGDYKKSDVGLSYGSQGQPMMLAQKFPTPADLERTPYLQSVKLATDCHNNNMKFELRVFAVGKDGMPGDDLLCEPLIFRVDRGKDDVTVDLTPYKVRFPENGIFVAVCWLMIPQNVKSWYDRRPMQFRDFDPGVGAIPSDEDRLNAYSMGRWQPVPAKPDDYAIRKFRGKFVRLAMALQLTN
jgi:hypothetical protein